MTKLRDLAENFNAGIAYLLIAYLFVNAVRILLSGDFTWSIYGFLIVLLVFVPPLYLRDRSALVPFEVIAFLCIPFTLKGLDLGFALSNILNYLMSAGVALLIISELDAFTSFRTTPRFSVVLVSVASLGVAGLWAVIRWLSDIYFSTGFLVSEEALMWEFTTAFIAGIVAGFVFRYYLSYRDNEVEL